MRLVIIKQVMLSRGCVIKWQLKWHYFMNVKAPKS